MNVIGMQGNNLQILPISNESVNSKSNTLQLIFYWSMEPAYYLSGAL